MSHLQGGDFLLLLFLRGFSPCFFCLLLFLCLQQSAFLSVDSDGILPTWSTHVHNLASMVLDIGCIPVFAQGYFNVNDRSQKYF